MNADLGNVFLRYRRKEQKGAQNVLGEGSSVPLLEVCKFTEEPEKHLGRGSRLMDNFLTSSSKAAAEKPTKKRRNRQPVNITMREILIRDAEANRSCFTSIVKVTWIQSILMVTPMSRFEGFSEHCLLSIF